MLQAVETLLENGADPNLPLGRNLGNAICALTTHEAHRCRTGLPTSSCLILLQKLMVSGADIFSKVKLPKGGMVGTAVDFAHIAFKRVQKSCMYSEGLVVQLIFLIYRIGGYPA